MKIAPPEHPSTELGYRDSAYTDPAKLERRAEWLRDYERRSEGYASCRIRETVGLGVRDAEVERVQKVHDNSGGRTRICRWLERARV